MTPEQAAILELHERLLAMDRRLAEIEARHEEERADLLAYVGLVSRTLNRTLPPPPRRRLLTGKPSR